MATQKRCPKCGKTFSLDADEKEVICPSCSALITTGDLNNKEKKHVPVAPMGPGCSKPGCLIKLFIVSFIISWIITTVLPSLLESKKSANEASAVSTLRTISCAQEMYHSKHSSFGTLMDLHEADLIDDVRAKGMIIGWGIEVFVLKLNASEKNWSCSAVPTQLGATGERSFYIDETGYVFWAPCEKASDPPADKNSRLLGVP